MFCMEPDSAKATSGRSDHLEANKLLMTFSLFPNFPKEVKYEIIKSFLILKDKTSQSIIENFKNFILLNKVCRKFYNYLNGINEKTKLTGYQQIIFNQFSIDDFKELNKYIFDTASALNFFNFLMVDQEGVCTNRDEKQKELCILIEFLIYHEQFDSSLKNCGNNLLELACLKNLQNIVASLLKYKIFDIDNSLIIASSNGYKEIVEMLIAAGANTAAKNSDGFTALNMALDHSHNEIAQILNNASSGSKHTYKKNSFYKHKHERRPKGCSVM